MEKLNIRRNTETPIDRDTFLHASGSSVFAGVGKINPNRISVHDLTAERVCFEPIDQNK